MQFRLGTHLPAWLTRTRFPLFVSARRLRTGIPAGRAICSWALDSGGFSELSLFGRWQTTPEQYVAEVRRWRESLGGMAWAAIQDWMCEPFLIARTGLSVAEHQIRTVQSWTLLRRLAPEIPWTPVVQGFTLAEYRRCIEMYGSLGTDLRELPLVGLGSVCRRQGTGEAEEIVTALHEYGLSLHAFGFKTLGLVRCASRLVSADSMAWSLDARRTEPLAGCHGHKNCANCYRYAEQWRSKLLARIA